MRKKLISNLFQDYLSKQKLAPNSIAIKKRAFKYFLSISGDCELPSENELPIQEYLYVLGEKKSTGTVETYRRNLSSFFSWLVRYQYLEKNSLCKLHLKRTPSRQVESYKPTELYQIFKIADKRWRVIIILALCGLRRSEILNLCRSDIDLNKVRVLITPKTDSYMTWEWENRNCLRIPVPIPDRIDLELLCIYPQEEIKELINLIPSDQPYVCLKPRHYSLMLQKKSEGIITFEDSNCPWRSFTRDFGLLLKKAKVKHKRFEDLRITYSMSLARMKMKIKPAQKLLRHRNILTTYTHYKRYKSNICEDV